MQFFFLISGSIRGKKKSPEGWTHQCWYSQGDQGLLSRTQIFPGTAGSNWPFTKRVANQILAAVNRNMATRAVAVFSGKRLPFKTENGQQTRGTGAARDRWTFHHGRKDFMEVSRIFLFLFPLAGDSLILIDAAVTALSQCPIDLLGIIAAVVNTDCCHFRTDENHESRFWDADKLSFWKYKIEQSVVRLSFSEQPSGNFDFCMETLMEKLFMKLKHWAIWMKNGHLLMENKIVINYKVFCCQLMDTRIT